MRGLIMLSARDLVNACYNILSRHVWDDRWINVREASMPETHIFRNKGLIIYAKNWVESI